MIEVKNLKKSFKNIPALKGISFNVSKGITGFLGPNGAGKSTTMKIIAGCLSADSGQVSICGHDILTQSRKARAHIGFMPESTPLDQDMNVLSFLKFRGQLKSLSGSKLDERIEKVVNQCELSEVLNRRIGNLSKGFKQRVGLADALIHEPSILILDEPTSGLDPNQIRSMRDVIKSISRSRTVLLSSHVLAEVESACDRVIVIHKGQVLADDSLKNIRSKVSESFKIRAVVYGNKQLIEKSINSISGVHSFSFSDLEATHSKEQKFEIEIEFPSGINRLEFEFMAPKVARALVENNLDLIELTQSQRKLEDIFQSLTLDLSKGDSPAK